MQLEDEALFWPNRVPSWRWVSPVQAARTAASCQSTLGAPRNRTNLRDTLRLLGGCERRPCKASWGLRDGAWLTATLPVRYMRQQCESPNCYGHVKTRAHPSSCGSFGCAAEAAEPNTAYLLTQYIECLGLATDRSTRIDQAGSGVPIGAA